MVRIRLARGGSKKAPFYRIVAADQRAARGGRFLEVLGTFNPRSKPEALNVKAERLSYWQKQGAQLSDTVRDLLKRVAKAPEAKTGA